MLSVWAKSSQNIRKSINIPVMIGLLPMLIFILGFAVYSQIKRESSEVLDMSSPLKLCGVYHSENLPVRVIASDNVFKYFLLLKGKDSLILYSFLENTEVWKSQISGIRPEQTIAEDNSLYFITTVNNETEGESYILNSLSLKTGIANWQLKVSSINSIGILKSNNLLFLNDKSNKLSAVKKENGTIVWEILLDSKIQQIESSQAMTPTILTEKKIYKISPENGQILQIRNIPPRKSGRIESYAIEGNLIVLGTSDGEVFKISYTGDYGFKNSVAWTYKVGGRVSHLKIIAEGILVTSFDNFIYLIDLKNGKLKWKKRIGGRIDFSPLVIQNYALVSSSSSNIISLLDLKEGKLINQVSTKNSNYFSARPQISGNFLIVETYQGIYTYSFTECK